MATNHDSIENLLSDWRRRVRESQFAHYEAVKPLVRANYMLGIPVAALSTFVATSIFASLESEATFEFRILIGLISASAAVLSALQTFLRLAERAEKHRAVAARYGSLRREIEFMQAVGAPYETSKLESIREKIDSVSTEAPEISERIWKKTEALLKSRAKLDKANE